ncbi:guanylate-binding protein 1-like [Pluvialis apricaria]
MASEVHMPEPVCLIENTQTNGLVVHQEALQVLSEITQPVVVVGITGLYHTGKSYLMNRLACQRKGFSLGSGLQSHTKGIWMWCVPHPCQPGHTLVPSDVPVTCPVNCSMSSYPTGNSPEVQRYNQPRECIRQLFPNRKCFVFDQPAHKRDLVRLEELQDHEIDPEFQQQVEKFCRHIWENSSPKTIPGGRIITGTLLGKLAEAYVEAIQSGAVPCLESAVLALAKIANAAAVEEAVKLYQDLMEERAKLPTETVQELLDLHSQCEREALEHFQTQAFEDDIRHIQADLIRRVEEIKETFCTANEKVSRLNCEAALWDLFQDIDRNISAGVYSVPGSYHVFKQDQQALLEKYRKLPGKGVKADAVLLEFLQRIEALEKIIVNTQLSLAEKDKELKSAREQYVRAQNEWEARWKKMNTMFIVLNVSFMVFPFMKGLKSLPRLLK